MWAVWGNATAFLITISAAIIRVSACSWTRLSLPQVGGSISQSSFPRIVTSHSSTVCLVSLRKSWLLPGCCSQGPQKGPGWSWGREDLLGHSLPRKALSPFPSAVAACTCPGRSWKWNACCTVSRRGAAARPEDHTGWANHVLYHCALESPLDGPLWGRGESRPQACPRFRGLGSLSGPFLRTLVSVLIFLVHRHFPRALCAVTLVLGNPS